MSDVIDTVPELDIGAADDPFAAVPPQGPFGFKPDRNRPIEPHFDGFGRLTPHQARQVLDVRDGRQPRCLLEMPTELVLVEHVGQGYCDPATGRQWGYRIRRIGRAAPPDAPAALPVDPPPAIAVDQPAEGPPAVEAPVAPVRFVLPPRVVPKWVAPEREAEVPTEPFRSEVPPEPDDEWAAPARSPRAVAMADPAERAALVRVLVIWFVVVLLLTECVTLLSAAR